MYKKFFQRLNYFIYLLITVFAVIVQTTVFSYSPFHYFHPDILFIIAIYFGYRKSLVEGAVILVIAAKILEANSSAPPNFFIIISIYTLLMSKMLSRVLVLKSVWTSTAMISCFLYILKEIGMIAFIGLHNRYSDLFSQIVFHFLPGMLMQAILAPVLFSFFIELDLKTWSDDHAEDEYDLNKGI